MGFMGLGWGEKEDLAFKNTIKLKKNVILRDKTTAFKDKRSCRKLNSKLPNDIKTIYIEREREPNKLRC